MKTNKEQIKNLAESCISYYKHEDFKADYLQILFELMHESEDEIINKIIHIAKDEYYFEQDNGCYVDLSKEQAKRIFDYITENIEEFSSSYSTYYVGDLSLEFVSFGEQEEQLTGFEDYDLKELKEGFDNAGYVINGDYAYMDLSGSGLIVELIASKLKDLLK